MNENIKIGDIFASNNFGKIKIIDDNCGFKNKKKLFKVKFLNSNNIYIFDKYCILSGQIQDTDFIYKRIIGEVRNSNSCGPFKILNIVSQSRRVYYEVEFVNTGYKTKARKDQIDCGRVTDATLLNKKEKEDRYNTLYYKIKKRSKDKNIELDLIWKEDKNSFKEWYIKHKYIDFLEIDKDILSIQKNNGILKYSPNTCLLLPGDINNNESLLHSIPRIHNKENKFYIKIDSIILGLENYRLESDSLNSLINKYLFIIYKGFKKVVNNYKNVLPQDIYYLLMNLDLNKYQDYILKTLLKR